MTIEDIKEKCKALGVLMKVQTGEEHEIDDKMASAVTAALEDVTNRKFTKNMQQKKEEKISN
ncbi:hypothetical protein [Agathobacter rectalis]|jgi:hypothetical protein|uniref:hypothetical protein n=1 Tax=Agathobacter rectalis TaxID=39491 RepID=UPI00269A1242|nr:hypothetical protein [Agathobacter rectalis]